MTVRTYQPGRRAPEIDTWENEGGPCIPARHTLTLTTPRITLPVTGDSSEVTTCPATRNTTTIARPTRGPGLVRWWLTELPDLYAQQSNYLLPGTRPADPTTRYAPPSSTRPPLTLDVIDLTDTRTKPDDQLTPSDLIEHDRMAQTRRLGIIPTLGLWVSLVMDELLDLGQDPATCCPTTPDGDGGWITTHTITGEVDWLLDHLDQILDLHPDFADDIEAMHRDLRHTVGDRDPFHIVCPYCRNTVEPHGDNAWFQCVACFKSWTMSAELRRLGATQPDMPLSKIAGLIGRSLHTLRKWAMEGRIEPIRRRGQTLLYDLERVRKVSDQITARAARKRVK